MNGWLLVAKEKAINHQWTINTNSPKRRIMALGAFDEAAG